MEQPNEIIINSNLFVQDGVFMFEIRLIWKHLRSLLFILEMISTASLYMPSLKGHLLENQVIDIHIDIARNFDSLVWRRNCLILHTAEILGIYVGSFSPVILTLSFGAEVFQDSLETDYYFM